MPAKTNAAANRLIKEKSPYLLQHAHNPVDWYPWGDAAFQKAKDEDKPIFLSIGYSTCHWCHVMERESFEDEEVAKRLNASFVAIKVDREERPDIDHIYMTVCQALTGGGGWPLTVILTPERLPFFAGTYFPKHDRMGLPGLLTLLANINKLWADRREELLQSGAEIAALVRRQSAADTEAEALPPDTDRQAFSAFRRNFDARYGGFGSAPKFPTPHNLLFLLRHWHNTGEAVALAMVETTLSAMYQGGIYDHIGFGFARYSTDRQWLVPHFEKMLYDNALLAIAYLEAYQATHKPLYAAVARQIFTYVEREMTAPEGGFYAAEDADSEGEEGKFYLWSPEEVTQLLGEADGEKFCARYDITPGGNFVGGSIPNLIGHSGLEPEPEFVARSRDILFRHRERRIHPFKDDKILTGWNGLMIAALALGARILGEPKYAAAAAKASEFILRHVVKNGRLQARYRAGETANPAYAEDYACLIWGLIELYEATYTPEHLSQALQLNDDLLRLFWDETAGGLFLYGSDAEALIARPKEIYDGATPAANSVATLNFLRLARLTGRYELEEKAQQQFNTFGGSVARSLLAHSFFLMAYLFAASNSQEIVVVSDQHDGETDSFLQVLRDTYLPFAVSLLYGEPTRRLAEVAPLVKDYAAVDGKPTVYICENFACRSPITGIEELKRAIKPS